MRRLPLYPFVLGLAFGCVPPSHSGESYVPLEPIPPTGQETSAVVGPAGGVLVNGAVEVEIPPGALDTETEIRIIVSDVPVSGGFTGYSPVYRFEPVGVTFSEPVTVRLPFDGDRRTASIFWTTRDWNSYAALPTNVDGGVAVTQTSYFSQAFVGTGCADDDCCDRANGELDLLLVVDNSNSMMEEQASLEAQIPRLVHILATGDIDEDGVQDFPALNSVRVGTVTTDMGTRGIVMPTCGEPNFGDDGLLRTEGREEAPECAATYPPVQSYSADRGEDPAAFAEGVACVATAGTGGCGFEQPLDAMLKALIPSTSGISFHGGTTGHGVDANAGLLRPDSILATVIMSDEDDCSIADPELVNPDSTLYGGTDLNLRCHAHPEAQHSVARYIDGLGTLRANQDDLIFGVVAGIPLGLTTMDGPTDIDAILGDARMAETIDPAMPNRLRPSCETPGRGLAFPPRRLLQVARGLGPNSTVQSICQEDFTPIIDALLRRIANRARGACVAR